MSKPFDEKQHPRTEDGRFTLKPTGRDHVPGTTLISPPAVNQPNTSPQWSLVAQSLGERSDAYHQLHADLATSGLDIKQQKEVMVDIRALMDGQDTYTVLTPLWEPTPPQAIEALRDGNLDVYKALTSGVDETHRIRTVNDISWEYENTWPNSGAPVNRFLQAVSHTTVHKSEQGDLEDVHLFAGQTHGHPFRARVGYDYRIQQGRTTTVADVRGLLERTKDDRTLRSFDDLITACYLTGPVSLKSGTWTIDSTTVASDIFTESFDMEEEAVYQAYALTYSNGTSLDSGWDSEWSPHNPHEPVIPACQEWLQMTGRTTSGFGAWATRTPK